MVRWFQVDARPRRVGTADVSKRLSAGRNNNEKKEEKNMTFVGEKKKTGSSRILTGHTCAQRWPTGSNRTLNK